MTQKVTTLTLRRHRHNVYIGKGSPFCPLSDISDNDYRRWLWQQLQNPAFAQSVKLLQGKKLAVYNLERDTHARILINAINYLNTTASPLQ
jgi:hypothetical protein